MPYFFHREQLSVLYPAMALLVLALHMTDVAALQTKVSALPNTVSATGDAKRGKQLYETRCTACHSVTENGVGPKHQGVLGRKAGGVKDYSYSDALEKSTLVWDRKQLEVWLTEPEKLIAGQKMGFRLEKAQDRADVVAYLASLK